MTETDSVMFISIVYTKSKNGRALRRDPRTLALVESISEQNGKL